MNQIILKGIIKDIQPSHSIGDIQYDQAKMVVKRESNKEDIIDIKFKKFTCKYNDGDRVTLLGNLRTYSQQLENKNKVHLYVYTYFDVPNELFDPVDDDFNEVILDGSICKKSNIRKVKQNKDVIDFIIANNLQTANKFINCYIPSITWGSNAKLVERLPIGTKVEVQGRFQSREYKKFINEVDYELHIAHELSIKEIRVIEDIREEEKIE